MTPSTILTTARFVLQDNGITAPFHRQSDAELLGYVNDAIREAATLRPELFSTLGDMTCMAGRAEQGITFLDAFRLLDVLCIHDGNALTPMDRKTMDQFRPQWRTDPAGPAEQWAALEGDPLKFFIYPRAPIGQVLDVKYLRNPGTYALGDSIDDVPGIYEPALADYVIYRSEMKDSEHVLSERAAAHYTAFKAKFGAN